jgi:hypothetical protein
MGSKQAPLFILAAVLVLGGGILAYLRFSGPPPGPAPLTPEAKAYVPSLKLGPIEMRAASSYVNQTLTEFEGSITNGGNRTIRSLEIYCVFYDVYNQVVRRERTAVIRSSARPLQPGETRRYRLAFDDIPSGWNNQLPELVIAQITFQ